jgi:hypothetical protein
MADRHGGRRGRKGRIEEVSDRLGDIVPRAGAAVHETFERAAGEVWLRHEDAPDRDDYVDYELYLQDAHEWAREELQEAAQVLENRAQNLGGSTEGYPELGDHRIRAEDDRDRVTDDVDELLDVVERVLEAEARLAKLEENYS